MRRALTTGIVSGLILLALPYAVPAAFLANKPADSFARPGGSFITVDGVRTFVESAGPSGGPPVVLVHGFGGSTFSWRKTLPALGASGFHAVALDLKGFGLADKRFDSDYSHAAQAEFVAHIMDVLGIQRGVLVGHSMGGNVVAQFALAYPDRVSKLVIVDGAIVTDPSRSSLTAGALFNVPPIRQWGRLVMHAYLTPERLTEMLRTAYADPAAVTPEVAAGYTAQVQIMDWDLALMGVVRDGGRNALPKSIGAITAPVWIAWGERDTWVPVARGQALRAAIPQAEWATFSLSGHLPMEEEPEAFNARLIEFLGQ